MLALLLLFAPALNPSSCIDIDGGRITAADLTGRAPAFAAIAPSTDLGPAPIPGVRRAVFPAELAQWARRAGFAANPEDLPELCFKIRMRKLRAGDFAMAVSKSAQAWDETAKVEVTDFARYEVPNGVIEFPLSGLARPAVESPDEAVLWKGRVLYAARNSFAVWAKVRIHARKPAVVALGDLPAGKPISGSTIAVQDRSAFPGGPLWFSSADQIVGAAPRRLIASGEALTPALVVSRLAVEKGERVEVRVSSGGAVLGFHAISEAGGRTGDTILLRNPETGKKFKGQVVAKAKVTVEVN